MKESAACSARKWSREEPAPALLHAARSGVNKVYFHSDAGYGQARA